MVDRMPALPPTAGTGTPPLRAGYLVRRPLPNLALRGIDAMLSLLVRRDTTGGGSVQRLLLAVGGHLGDAVIASAVLPLVRAALPDVRIGIVAPSWSRPVLRGHPEVAWSHTFDPWRTNRGGGGPVARVRRHLTTSRAAVAEIRAVGYDAAVDLYPYFPNTIPLLWRARIPVRVGYGTGGFGPLLTHPVPWRDADRHVAEYQLDLVRVVAPVPADAAPRYVLPAPRAVADGIADGVADAKAHGDEGPYVVVHMGAGAATKAWPEPRWHALLAALAGDGHRVVLTGAGDAECAAAERAARAAPGCRSVAGALDWDAFAACVGGARLLVSADTVAAHLAAAAGVPSVVVSTGIVNPHHFRPLGPSTVVYRRTACSPCHRSSGCEPMTCIRDVSVGEVLTAARSTLAGEVAGSTNEAGRR
jgi:ADP-heptose:LPS heptosyltransferase